MTRRVHPIVRFAVERRVTMTMVVLGVLVLGGISLSRLPLEFLPTFSSSSISVEAPYPSSSPEEIRRLILQPLEDSLGTINGIETLSASASAERASVRLSFLDGTNMDMAAVDVRDRIERVRHLLPSDLDRVTLRRFQSTDIPVLRFHVSASWPKERLYDFVENTLMRRLERLEGVAQVAVDGLRSPQLQIDVNPDRLRSHGLDVRTLVANLRSNNVNLSAGDLKEGSRKLLVRAVGEMATVDEFRHLPVGPGGLTLADVAEVSYTFPRQESFSFLNGVEALTVSINKTSTANLLAVVERVKVELDTIASEPRAEGLTIRIYDDNSEDVRLGLAQLRDAGLVGGGLAILAVFFFLRRFRTTALIAVAIPISVVATFVIMYLMRQAHVSEITLNVVSLAGLMLALGMLVDPAIVVIESIFRHRNELGEDSKTAALAGTSEVALPIVASTATTLCVFLPLIFFQGGGWFQNTFKNIATTTSIVIFASMLVALTVVPMAAVILLRHQHAREPGLVSKMYRAYGRILAFTLDHRFAFVLSMLAFLGGAVYLFSTIERSFASPREERQVTLNVDTPRQYSLEQTTALYGELYALLDARRDELGIADIAYAYDRGSGRSRSGWRRGRCIELYLKDESETSLTPAEVRERIRPLLPTRAGVDLRIAQGEGRHGSSGVEVELMGDDPVVLELISRQLSGQLARLPMIRDVDTSLESGDEEIHVRLDPERTQEAGLSSEAVAFTVANALSGRAVSYFKTGDREVDVILQYREEDRETLDQLKNVPVFGARREGEVPVALPLAAVASFERTAGPRTIERENHRSKVSVSANVTDPRASFAALGMIRGFMAETPLPPGYEWSFGRWTRFQQQDQASSWFLFVFAGLLVYMLMAALFESYAQPLTIMLSVPFALLGVALVLKFANQPLGPMESMGLTILMGLVVNNAIVLIDHINQLRAEGHSRREAILLGGQHRLRPILITAVTTILGLLPLVAPILFPRWFGPVEGRSGSWAPIGLVILGGLTTSTFLTLIITPTLYSLVDDLTLFAKRVVAKVQKPVVRVAPEPR